MSKDKDYFMENLSMLLTSGMGITSALDSIRADIRSPRMKKEIAEISEDIGSGTPMWRALSNRRFVSPHVISLIKLGEESGRLSENLNVVVAEEEKNRLLKSKIRSAMMYPALVLALTFVIGVGIAWFILPRLATVFSQLRIELPFITKMLIGLGKFLGEWGFIVMPVFIAFAAAAVFFIFINKKTKYIGEEIIFRLPGINKLLKEVEVARFGFMLGTLLDAGLAINSALDSLAGVTSLRPYRNFYFYLKNSIEDGNSFSRSFDSYKDSGKLIPASVQHMIGSGEKSGNLSKTLLNVGNIYENKTETTTKNLTVLLEPVLLFIVWGGVVMVALAIILPIYSLIGGLGQSG